MANKAAQGISKALKGLKDYAGTLANASIVLATGGIEQIATVAIFRCPCVEPPNLGPGCNVSATSLSCTPTLNYTYGFSLIFAPAFALLLISAAANPKLWKSITGCCKKEEQHKRGIKEVSFTMSTILLQSLISPVTWICIALLDGQYLACAITPLPYRVGPTLSATNCESIAGSRTLPFSNAFHDSRALSQVIGAISIMGLLLIGSLFYCTSQCTFPLTYYHAKYYELYRKYEITEFEDEMNKKAQEDAEKNVKKFLEKRREKEIWDRISTVFQFHRDGKKLALYSQLHEWALEECNAANEIENDLPVTVEPNSMEMETLA